ncbi:MAG: membrane dipeptidase [bacterium]|nr:dipeptidase [Acidimicrobiia bacterium]MCY4650119.1 membrane dipeptidase [bacterium]
MSGAPAMAVADCHNDLLLAVEHQRRRGYSDPFGDFWLPQLRAGGVVLQVLPVYTEEEFVSAGALRRALIILETARWMADVHRADVAIAENGPQIEEIIASGRIAMLLALEGGEPFGADLGLVDGFARLGVRMASLTWNRRTMLADGVGVRSSGGGLTPLGREAVSELERCGVILDVSHLADAGLRDVLEVAGRPVVASHSSCRALYCHPRNLSDDQIIAIARTGGMVCLNAFGGFLSEAPSLDDYITHIAHAVSLIGDRAVGIGADFIDDVLHIVDPILGGALADEFPTVPNLESPADYPSVAAAMADRLPLEAAQNVLGQNLIRFLKSML